MGITYGYSFGDDENVPKLTIVTVAQLCEYISKHSVCQMGEAYGM